MQTERTPPKLPTTLSRSATVTLRTKKLHLTPARRGFDPTADNSSLGPGTYEIKSTLRSNDGYSFPVREYQDDSDRDVSTTQPITGFRYSYLDNPGPGYYPIYPTLETKGFSFPSAIGKREGAAGSPGPGRYYLAEKTSGGYFFSPTPRFDLSPIERLACTGNAAYAPRLHRISKEERERIRQRVEENKDLSRFSPEERAKSLQRLASTHARKVDLTRSTKFLLDEEKHHTLLTRLDEKVTRMTLRLNSHVHLTQQVRLVKKTWIYCLVLTSACHSLQLKVEHFHVAQYSDPHTCTEAQFAALEVHYDVFSKVLVPGEETTIPTSEG